MKNSEMIKSIRSEAKKVGLTFKNMKRLCINGVKAWGFYDRKTGEAVLYNCTLDTAYDNVCSGYVSTYDQEKGEFNGFEWDKM